MSDIYEALLVQDNGFRKRIAAKKLKPELQHKKSIILNEAKIQASLNHPNICTIFDIQEQNNQIYLLTEYLEGQTLKEKILDHKKKNTKFTKSEVEKIFGEIASALKYIHSHNVVHRDLSTSNIFITHSNTVKLIDFGMAEEDVQYNETQYTKTISGSLEYLSPERVDGILASFASDYFSAGIILYEMLTLKNPFKKDSDFKTLEAIKYEEISTDSIISEFVDFNVIVDGLLNKNPQKRFNSIDIDAHLYAKRPKNSIAHWQSYITLISIVIALIVGLSLFIYFEQNMSQTIFKDTQTGKGLIAIENITSKQLSTEACSRFFLETLSKYGLIFDEKTFNEFKNGRIKRTDKQAIYEVISFINYRDIEFEKMFNGCAHQKNSTKIHDRFRIYKNELTMLSSDMNKLTPDYLKKWQEQYALDITYLFEEPYPNYYAYEKTLSEVISIFSNQLSYDPTEKIIFIKNERIPEFIGKKVCADLGDGVWITTFLTGNYAIQNIDNMEFIIYNPKKIDIKKMETNTYSVNRNENYSICHFKKTSFTSSESTIY